MCRGKEQKMINGGRKYGEGGNRGKEEMEERRKQREVNGRG